VSARTFLALLAVSALALGPAGIAGTAGTVGTASAASTGDESQSPLSDQGSSPNYRSTITSVSPQAHGLGLQVLQFSDRLQLHNQTGKTVTVEGYEGEPYLRFRPSGAVEVNTRSPAYFLNQSFYGNVTVPQSASAKAPPHWKLVDGTGQFEWHDHRIHWMSPALPPQVKDKGKRTLIFAWHVPIAVEGHPGSVAGRLFWVPNSSSAPVAAIVIGGAIVVLGLLLVLTVRRRRGTPQPSAAGAAAAGAAGAGGGTGARPDASKRGGVGNAEGGADDAEESAGHREAW
jgi:hypothetical protein